MSIKDSFPDGTLIDKWFYDTKAPSLKEFKNIYNILDFGVKDDGNIYTKELQNLIDKVSLSGGLLYIPKGTYLSGALFIKGNVSVYLEKGAVLKASDDINDFPLSLTRIEGETCEYYPALLNFKNCSNIALFGEGAIDGNGLKFWKEFWQRLKENPSCTNKEVHRPRLTYFDHCSDVTISGLSLINSPFWTNHLYKCDHIKFLSCKILAPKEPVPAPSSDAIDIDACSDILIKGCYFAVNDDGVALKGGKGPWADEDPNNGINERILIEKCEYGFVHSILACGSESIHNRNILVRNIKVAGAWQLLHLKLRPDTPSSYEHIKIENVKGYITGSFLNINPWTQFFDLKGRKDKPISLAKNITFENINLSCECFFNVKKEETQYELSDFLFKNLEIHTKDKGTDYNFIRNNIFDNVKVSDSDERD